MDVNAYTHTIMLHAQAHLPAHISTNITLHKYAHRHIYQRTASYFSHSKASTVIFSNIRRFASDLTSVSPDHMVCVPLVLDTLYSRVGAFCRDVSNSFMCADCICEDSQRHAMCMRGSFSNRKLSSCIIVYLMCLCNLLTSHLFCTRLHRSCRNCATPLSCGRSWWACSLLFPQVRSDCLCVMSVSLSVCMAFCTRSICL